MGLDSGYPSGKDGTIEASFMADSAQKTNQEIKAAPPAEPAVPSTGHAVTPMMAQYSEIRTANPDCLLFYRMGDFYELFFEDAIAASQALGIALTKRGKHEGHDIPMCGVPVHAADHYLQRLIRLGFRVAVCEQMEDPAEAKKRGAKAVVRRDVVRLVTPGTLTEESLLDAQKNNFLTSLFRLPGGEGYAFASVDISTGEFLIAEVAFADLSSELARLQPREVVVSDRLDAEADIKNAVEQSGAVLTPLPQRSFDSKAGERSLKTFYGVASIEGFGAFSRGELCAVAGVLRYVELTQIGQKPALRPPLKVGPQSSLVIDAATQTNLELVRTIRGEKRGCLLHAIDRTVTGAGARELASRLASPLVDPKAIGARLDAVRFLLEFPSLRQELRDDLKSAPDIARALSRLCLNRGGPRDLGAIREGLGVARTCGDRLGQGAGVMGLPNALAEISEQLQSVDAKLRTELQEALVDDLPALARDGNYVRQGYRDDLDKNRMLRDESREILSALQAAYSERTGIGSLKIRHNNVLGYFVEVTATHGKTLLAPPHSDFFIHRQTLASAVRFTTAELSETEIKITTAADCALAIEQEVFRDLVQSVIEREKGIAISASALAALDCYAGLAVLAEEQSYTAPIVDDSVTFRVEAGRHPVVEQVLAEASDTTFIENDCFLGPGAGDDGRSEGENGKRIWIVTGPNMAGKSTFLRQNALIIILAQMGSFVPARAAHIGAVDRLFCRVGASDDLARGRSTFMVEMVETAGILNQASDRSFVILDEIGRGTATYDGLSIAWATVEYLHEINCCRALFATHYHELTALAQKLAHTANATIEVKEWQDEIVFLHKVIAGAADRSYGIQVAKLAGLPDAVTNRAGEVLRLLEAKGDSTGASDLLDDLPLFAASRPKGHAPDRQERSEVEQALTDLNPDELTPRDALEALYRLKKLCNEPSGSDSP